MRLLKIGQAYINADMITHVHIRGEDVVVSFEKGHTIELHGTEADRFWEWIGREAEDMGGGGEL